MESDTERGVGSFGNDGEELSPMMTITSLNRGMDSIVAKAGTLSTLENIKGITSFERKFKRAIDTTPAPGFCFSWRAGSPCTFRRFFLLRDEIW